MLKKCKMRCRKSARSVDRTRSFVVPTSDYPIRQKARFELGNLAKVFLKVTSNRQIGGGGSPLFELKFFFVIFWDDKQQ